MPPTKLYLGVDGGGTRTRAWLVDPAGQVLGAGESGPSNPNNVGPAGAGAAIGEAARSAGVAARVAGFPVQSAFVGCAGIKTAADCATFGAALHAGGLAARVDVANDTEAALAGGLGGAPGIVLIAGTGSFCLGRDARHQTAARGGWGWLLDDIGGAFWIGREAVRAVALAADGRAPATSLREPVLNFFGIAEPAAILAALYHPDMPPIRLAELSRVVTAAASAGDAVAGAILDASAHAAAELVRLVARALHWHDPLRLVIVGGLGRSGAPYTPRLHDAIRAAVPEITIVPPLLPPVAGAALRALEAAGVNATPGILASFKDYASRHASD